MHRIITVFSGAVATALTFFLFAPAAEAAFATWVSGTGTDVDSCTAPDHPCRQIGGGGALSKTSAGGVVHVLPGDYDSFEVLFPVNIIVENPGQAAIAANVVAQGAFTAGISVETTGASDVVRVRGLTVVRHGAAGGGIMLQSAGGILHIEDCTFVGSSNSFGILFAPTGAGELHISNSTTSDNGNASAGGGILIKPTGSGSAKVLLDNVTVGNNRAGILIDGATTTGTNTVTIRNSTVAGSAASGIFAIDSGGGATNVMVEGSTSASNATFGIAANGANVTERVRNSTVTGNGTGLIATNASKLISLGGNVAVGNTANGSFTQTVGQQ
jgi:hypothetical protein